MSTTNGHRSHGASSSSAKAQQQFSEVVLLREHCISIGRPVATVITPILHSLLDTIFWGDGYKSLAHVVFISFGWWKGLVGLRFMTLLLYFHVISAVIINTKKQRSASATQGSEERRAALYAFRASTAYLADLVERYPYLFFVLPQLSSSSSAPAMPAYQLEELRNACKRKLHGTVLAFTVIFCMMWFPVETRVILNSAIYYVTAAAGYLFGYGGVEDCVPSITVYDVLDLIVAPMAVLIILIGGLGKVGPKDPRYLTPTSSTSQTASSKQFPTSSSASTAASPTRPQQTSSSSSNNPQLANSTSVTQRRSTVSPAANGASGESTNAPSSLDASNTDDIIGSPVRNSNNEDEETPSGDADERSLRLACGFSDKHHFLTRERMDQMLGEGFSFNNSQSREEVLLPLLKAMSVDGTRSMPYWMMPTPDGEWDLAVKRMPMLPAHAHKILAMITNGPNWTVWKRHANKPERKPLPGHGDGRNPIADAENAEDDVVTLNHVTGFSQVKCGFNRARVRGVKFDDVISWLCDDIFKENGEPAKAAKDLNVFKYDVFLSEYRRLAYHTYTVNTPEGPISAVAKVIHFMYKQMVIGVAARDCPMYTTARELTEEELRHYNLFGSHATTFYPHRVAKNGKPQPLGRVFLISSSPAANVPPAPGHVKATIHRHAILVITPPKKSECGDVDDDEHEIVDIITMMCGEPGGKIPSFAVEIARGEQLKVITAIYTNVVADMKEAGLCTYPGK